MNLLTGQSVRILLIIIPFLLSTWYSSISLLCLCSLFCVYWMDFVCTWANTSSRFRGHPKQASLALFQGSAARCTVLSLHKLFDTCANTTANKTSAPFSSVRKPARPLKVFRTPSRHPSLENWIVGFNLIWKSIWEGDFHSLCSLALEAIPTRPRMLAELNVINSKWKKAGVRCRDGSG